ncbi:MAG: four-helix bundle copper-binding protein [Bacteroidota bacterium]
MSHKQNQELLDQLNNCAALCNHCATACLEEDDVKMMARCIKLDTDCAEMCRVTASFVARGSEHAPHLLRECAEICAACAEECEKHAGMEHCRECAESCRACAEACASLVEA